MDKKQLVENLNKTIEQIDKIIERVNYAKVRHKSTVVITCCGDSAYYLKGLQKELIETAAGLASEEKQISDGLNQNAGELDSVIEDLNYAKSHYKSTVVSTCCGRAVKKLGDVQKNLVAISSKAGAENEQPNEPEQMGM